MTTNMEISPGKPGDAHDALEKLHGDINKDPCHCLEHLQDQNPYALGHYRAVAQRIPEVVGDMQKQSNRLYQLLGISHFRKTDEDRIRKIIDTLSADGPTYTERNGKTEIQRNPKAQYLLQFNLNPGLINGQNPVVTVNGRKILDDIAYLEEDLLPLHQNNPIGKEFLCFLIRALKTYGEKIDATHMQLARQKNARWNSETTRAFGKMGRATAFVLLAAGTLVTGILSIFGRQSPTAAALYGALAFLVANPGILTPGERRDAHEALSILKQTGLHGTKGQEQRTLAQLCQTILGIKNNALRALLKKSPLTPEELKTLTTDLTSNNSTAAKYLQTQSQRKGLASLLRLSKGIREHVEGFIERVLTGKKTTSPSS